MLQHVLRATLKHVLHRRGLQIAHVASVLAINFLRLLATGHELICGIYHYAVVSMQARSIGIIVWLVLTPEEVSAHPCYATERHPSSIEKVPRFALVLNGAVLTLRLHVWLFSDERPVNEFVVQAVKSVAHVGIERDAGEFFFDLQRLSKLRHLLALLLNRVNGVVTLPSIESRELHFLLWLRL